MKANIAKLMHVFFQFLALATLTVGLSAIFVSMNQENKTANLVSMHSWVGVAAATLFLYNFISISCRELVKRSPYAQHYFPKAIENSLQNHRYIGLCTIILMAILAGIESSQGDCSVQNTNPAINYDNLSEGCKISNGNNYLKLR